MNPTRKLLGAAAFSFALAGGGVAGALLGTPTFSGAQDDTDASSDESTDSTREGPGRFGHRGEGLAAAAEALGMSADDLRSALRDGESIAQVAEDQGVGVQTVIDALVADATARLNELEASLPERMTELVNRTNWGDRDRDGGDDHEGPGGRHPRLRHLGIAAAAEAIGITADELRTALADGSTVADVAEANDVAVQTVIDALVADATARLDEAVANGKIDVDRAEEIKANLVDRITAHVNGDAPTSPDGAPHGDDVD